MEITPRILDNNVMMESIMEIFNVMRIASSFVETKNFNQIKQNNVMMAIEIISMAVTKIVKINVGMDLLKEQNNVMMVMTLIQMVVILTVKLKSDLFVLLKVILVYNQILVEMEILISDKIVMMEIHK